MRSTLAANGDPTSLYIGIAATVVSSVLIGWLFNRELRKVLYGSPAVSRSPATTKDNNNKFKKAIDI